MSKGPASPHVFMRSKVVDYTALCRKSMFYAPIVSFYHHKYMHDLHAWKSST